MATINITADADDGDEFVNPPATSGSWASRGNLLYAGYNYGYEFNPGFRFLTFTPAQGDTIDTGTLTLDFYKEIGAGGAGTIHGYDTDDALSWGARLPTQVARTTATAAWPQPGSAAGVTINVQTILQEIVDRGGWVANNDIALFMLTNSATGNQHQVDDYGFGTPAKITFTFTPGAGGGGIEILRRRIEGG